jgi:hypothetical protein
MIAIIKNTNITMNPIMRLSFTTIYLSDELILLVLKKP